MQICYVNKMLETKSIKLHDYKRYLSFDPYHSNKPHICPVSEYALL